MLPREFIVSTSDVTSAVKRMIRAVDRPASHEEEERFFMRYVVSVGGPSVVYQKAKDRRPCVIS